MSLDSLTRMEFQTTLGTIPLWHRPGALEGTGPVVLTINSAFVSRDTLSRLPKVLSGSADVFIMHMPGGHAPQLKDISFTAFAAAVDEVIATAFSDRPVVATGVGTGALTALTIRAKAMRWVVAVEPHLIMDGLWFVHGAVRKIVAKNPDLARAAEALFGVSSGEIAPRNYLPLLEGLSASADVLVGEILPGSPRTLDTTPSVVNETARRDLQVRANVRLVVVPSTGHGILDANAELYLQHLRQAVMAAAAWDGFEPALLTRSPLTVKSLAYVGAAPDAFAAAYAGRNPDARVLAVVADVREVGPFDVVVTDNLAALDPAWLGRELAFDGLLVARIEGGPDALRSLPSWLTPARLHTASSNPDYFDDVNDAPPDAATPGALVMVARRRDRRKLAPVHIRSVTYAPRLMDIRTRLPAKALRADPDLAVAYHGAPFRAPDHPAILLLQRPGSFSHETWLGWMSAALRKRCLLVLEWDDHPDLITKATGLVIGETERKAFGYCHAIQTSTPELARFFSEYNPEVQVFENTVFDLPPFPEEMRGPRIFYGAAPRGPFSLDVMKSLAPALSAHPEVKVVVVGDRAVFDAVPTLNKRFHGFLPYDSYLATMASCSILLTPLAPDLNNTKSDAKFLDASSHGLLTIASPAAYESTVRHRESGLIAASLGDWNSLLAEALADPKAGHVMARRAYDYVRATRMFAQQAKRRRDWYKALMNRRSELDAAVMARLPGLAQTR